MLNDKNKKEKKVLNRLAWHQPRVSIIITHYNYSDFLEEALLSVIDQSHENWEIIIVDDASDKNHLQSVKSILEDLAHNNIHLLSLDVNVGQIPAFFKGFDQSDGQFVCLLDPDDRYESTFIEESVSAHLNNTVVCPLVCSEQFTLVNGNVVSSVLTKHNLTLIKKSGNAYQIDRGASDLLFFPSNSQGWPWTSTSSMMFRRSALGFLRPNKELAYKRAADAYLAAGAHLLGGTLFLTKPLVYRSLHEGNSWITNNIFSSFQDKQKEGAQQWSQECLADVMDAINFNKAPEISLWKPPADHNKGRKAVFHPTRTNFSPVMVKEKGIMAKWKRSIVKRWSYLQNMFLT